MNEPFAVFIPAAGLGERLRPVTSHIPKPLLPVLGKPLLQLILEKVCALGPVRIGMNVHYKGNEIARWAAGSSLGKEVVLFREDPILGTGGALKNAASFLSGAPFLVHNADILSEIDLGRLLDAHRSAGNLATLAVHDFPRFNNVRIDSRGFLRGVGQDREKLAGETLVAFTGIAAYDPAFLGFLPEGASSVVDAWLAAIAAGCPVGTVDFSSSYWNDIGTPSSYAAAVIRRLRREGETVHIDPTARGCRNAVLDGFVVMEEASSLGTGAAVRNCIILPEGRLKDHLSCENCLIGPDFVVPLDEREILGQSDTDAAVAIGTGGSGRRYSRVREGARSVVHVRFERDDPDFERHVTYTSFFRRHGVPVPALMGEDPKKKEALLEDLGDLSLYGWLRCRRSPDEIASLYRRVIDISVMIHGDLTDHLPECPLLQERVFDYEHLRWETAYFIERFVGGLKGVRREDASALQEEFHRLAVLVDSFPKTVIHRDFQSQNIMISGGIPRLIDYQGARQGPPAYDLASLLWDPYYQIEDAVRTSLIRYYIDEMKKKEAGNIFDNEAFEASLLPCRLQRHMQALGAYAFLSEVKGKKFFLRHVAEGLRLLKEDMSGLNGEYPSLFLLVAGL
jgi:NDP-sugar pyrophosphorylase family protein